MDEKENNGGDREPCLKKISHHLICHLPGHCAHYDNTKTKTNIGKYTMLACKGVDSGWNPCRYVNFVL